jgi:uncharacterized protein YkwD
VNRGKNGKMSYFYDLRRRMTQFFRKIRIRLRKIFNKKQTFQRQFHTPRARVRYGKHINIEKSIFHSLNNIRKRHKLSVLTWDDQLYATAQRRAEEISRNFSHAGCPSGCGENIAKIPLGNVRGLGFVHKQNIPQKFVSNWMRSDGHRENILRRSYYTGVIGVFQKGGNYFAVQLFL